MSRAVCVGVNSCFEFSREPDYREKLETMKFPTACSSFNQLEKKGRKLLISHTHKISDSLPRVESLSDHELFHF